ncbi:hypothetical protein [Bradyrhizobium liaoningense]|uniref:hypothetical protein n=1 Tax=Bradyrhizobium liaoningense TaxID=43992 RepID=UPI001BAA5D8B|nr:hypothetical protein [Bradyrhizobium liaoningense]MBR0945951.1 hypothetical protein [Bradyrhizobium liaoningense]
MNFDSAKRAQAGISRRGEVVSLRRWTGGAVAARADVRATVQGYDSTELVTGITAGSRRVIISRLDLEAADFPAPSAKGDRIYLGSSLDIPTHIETVDADRREYQGCYEITTAG